MSARSGILAAGTWLVDHIKLIDKFPAQDALCNIISERTANGGCPYNVLKDLSKMRCNFPLEAAGLIGIDADADFIIADCRAHGIDASRLVRSASAPTAHTDVMTASDTGRRTFFHNRGGNDLLEPAHIDLESSRAKIFLEGYFGLHAKMDALRPDGENGHSEIFRRAKKLGFITAADLVTADVDFAAITRASLPLLDILSLNETELQMVSGERTDPRGAKDISRITALARKIMERGIGMFLVVHFPECAVAFPRNGEPIIQPSLKVPKDFVKGSVGAGDAFLAGVLLGVHNGDGISQCLKTGVCAAAQSLSDTSSSDGLLPLESCLALADKFGFL